MQVYATRALFQPAAAPLTEAFQKLVPRIKAAADEFTIGRQSDTRDLVVVLHCPCGQCPHNYQTATMQLSNAVYVSPIKGLEHHDPRIRTIALYPPYVGGEGQQDVAKSDDAFIEAFVKVLEEACAPALADA